MAFGDRPDGVLLRGLPGFRKMFPFLMPTRTESVIFHEQRVRLGRTLAWLERFNAGRQHAVGLFHVILAACVRAAALRPDLNRFVVGRRIYQRRTIDLSFVIKRELTDESGETNLKLTFAPTDTLVDVAERVRAAVSAVKKSSTSSDERTCDLLTSLPRSLTRVLMWMVRALDYCNLLPASFIRGDNLYTTAFIANLGSLGLDAVYHHMFEWGSAGFFIVIGKRKKEPVVNEQGELVVEEVADIKFSLDERITDGVHYAKAISLIASCVEDPELLLTAPESIPDPFVFARKRPAKKAPALVPPLSGTTAADPTTATATATTASQAEQPSAVAGLKVG